MSFDGLFIHHLIEELRIKLIGGRINKIIQISELELLFFIRTKGSNIQLIISSSLDSPRIHISNVDYVGLDTPTNFLQIIKKHIEGGYILDIFQHQNDRIIILDVNVSNEIGDIVQKRIIIELMGRNSNVIITNSDGIIIDSIRRLPPGLDGMRTLLPKALYEFPKSSKTLNPFLIHTDDVDLSKLQGVSNLFINEVRDQGSFTLVMNNKIDPVIMATPQKSYYYAFPLQHIGGSITHYETLSLLLDQVYEIDRMENRLSQQHKDIEKFVSNELNKNQIKLQKQKVELEQANQSVTLQKIGELLSANLYRIKQGDSSVVVEDYYDNNHLITIELNPDKSPGENLAYMFSKVRKAKNAIIQLQKQIKITTEEIHYLQELSYQISISNSKDIQEIHEELVANKYIKKGRSNKNKKTSPKYDTYIDSVGNVYLVGKNNIQNEYITHKMASRLNYFFHVKDSPGAHVIARVENVPTEQVIRTAANLAALYSPLKQSSSVPVDYTQVKNIKKIAGQKGSHVLLFHQKTIYIDPNIKLFDELIKK